MVSFTLREYARLVGFYSGAAEVWKHLTEEEIDYLEEFIESANFTSLAEVNDFMWFDVPDWIEEMHSQEEEDF